MFLDSWAETASATMDCNLYNFAWHDQMCALKMDVLTPTEPIAR